MIDSGSKVGIVPLILLVVSVIIFITILNILPSEKGRYVSAYIIISNLLILKEKREQIILLKILTN